MEDEYLDKLKRFQEDKKFVNIIEDKNRKFKELIEEKKLNINLIQEKLDKLNNWKNELIEGSINSKKLNYNLFKNEIKHCLVCGYEGHAKTSSHLYSPCVKCNSKNWLVGDNYPCEICKRIILKPLIHHIDGNRDNNILTNLIFICSSCHIEIHHGHLRSKSKKERMYSKEKPQIKQRIAELNKIYYKNKKKLL